MGETGILAAWNRDNPGAADADGGKSVRSQLVWIIRV